MVKISAKTGMGLNDLKETVSLQAGLLDLKADRSFLLSAHPFTLHPSPTFSSLLCSSCPLASLPFLS